jgi:hypothetical protein
MLAATTRLRSDGTRGLRNRAAARFLKRLFASRLAIQKALNTTTVAAGGHHPRWSMPATRAGATVLLGFLSYFLHCEASFAQINYGSFSGTTVDYIDVTEQSTTGDALPLFGAPVLSANSLDFNPVGFDAGASGAGGMDSTGARLTYMIRAHAGEVIPIIVFSESGDTTLAGAGTDSTATQVTANGTITINAVDGAAITPIVRPISLTFTPSGGDYALTSDGGGLPIFHTNWTGSLAINLADILTTESVPFTLGATNVSIDVVNTLAARSETGTQSLIAKKDFGVAVIPEPGSLLILVFALVPPVGVGVFRRFSRLMD